MSEPPIFKVREGNPGFGWVVDVTWGGASEKTATDWVAKVYEILAKEK